MKFIANKMPQMIKETVENNNWNIDCDKYFVMTEDTDEHIGFMKEREDENGEKYFEILIFEPKINDELMIHKHIKGNEN